MDVKNGDGSCLTITAYFGRTLQSTLNLRRRDVLGTPVGGTLASIAHANYNNVTYAFGVYVPPYQALTSASITPASSNDIPIYAILLAISFCLHLILLIKFIVERELKRRADQRHMNALMELNEERKRIQEDIEWEHTEEQRRVEQLRMEAEMARLRAEELERQQSEQQPGQDFNESVWVVESSADPWMNEGFGMSNPTYTPNATPGALASPYDRKPSSSFSYGDLSPEESFGYGSSWNKSHFSLPYDMPDNARATEVPEFIKVVRGREREYDDTAEFMGSSTD